LFQASYVLFGNVRLAHKPENVVHVLDNLPLALWHGLAPLAHMNFVAFAGKLFVWPLATADPAVMSHPNSFQRLSSKMINRKWWDEGHGRE
jgi:hypothetical protein